jgi:hypothetical protein
MAETGRELGKNKDAKETVRKRTGIRREEEEPRSGAAKEPSKSHFASFVRVQRKKVTL